MVRAIIDSVSRSAEDGRLTGHYTTWQGNHCLVTIPESGSFLWVSRWVTVGPDGGKTDTVLGTVSVEQLLSILQPGERLEWKQVKSRLS